MKIWIGCALALLGYCSAAEAKWKPYFDTAVVEYVKKNCSDTDTCTLKFSKATNKVLIIEGIACDYEVAAPNLGLRGAELRNETSTHWHNLTTVFVGPQVIDSVAKKNVKNYDKAYASSDRLFMTYKPGETPSVYVAVVKNEPGGFPDVRVECKATGYFLK